MPRVYSYDLRIRLVRAVEGGLSARAAARVFQVSPSTAIKWMQRWRRTGTVAASRLGGGNRSKLDGTADWLLALVAAEPDLTLEEVRQRLRARGVAVGIGSVWRFFARQGLSFKKNRARRRAGPSRRRPGAAVLERRPAEAGPPPADLHR